MMQGVTQDDFITPQKSMLVAWVYLQQDAFDAVDVSTSIERQKQSFGLITRIIQAELSFPGKTEARRWFSRMTDALKSLNYAEVDSNSHGEIVQQIDSLLQETVRTGKEGGSASMAQRPWNNGFVIFCGSQKLE